MHLEDELLLRDVAVDLGDLDAVLGRRAAEAAQQRLGEGEVEAASNDGLSSENCELVSNRPFGMLTPATPPVGRSCEPPTVRSERFWFCTSAPSRFDAAGFSIFEVEIAPKRLKS